MPNRTIKESITTSCEIDQLTAEEERFFYRLIVICDDFGRMDARPRILRTRCFPLKVDTVKDSDVKKWLEGLIKAGLVVVYMADGKPHLQIVTFEKHNKRRANYSKYPDPPADVIACMQLPANVPETRDTRHETRGTSTNTEGQLQSTPYEKIKALYLEICSSLPKVITMSETRKNHIQARFKQYGYDIEIFRRLFEKAESSDFLKGKNNRGWRADFDWLMNETNMSKVLEDKYKNKEPAQEEPLAPYHRYVGGSDY